MDCEETVTKQEAIAKKIKNLRIGGETHFFLRHKIDDIVYFEFKIIEVAGKQYKVFGGFGLGYSLRYYPHHTDSEVILRDFICALKGIDLHIEDVVFSLGI